MKAKISAEMKLYMAINECNENNGNEMKENEKRKMKWKKIMIINENNHVSNEK